MIELLKQKLSSLKRTTEGEFDVVFIDESTREESFPTNIEVRKGYLYPKQGDLMQVARYTLGGCGSVYTPARVALGPTGLPKIFIDLTDWKIPQIRALDKLYEFFKSEIGAKNVEEARREEEKSDYELILVDSERKPLVKRIMCASGEREQFTLYNYETGKSPSQNLDLSFVSRLNKDNLIVDAVLHPLIGLPKVLIKEKNFIS